MAENNSKNVKQETPNISKEFKELLEQTYEENKDAMDLLKKL